MRRGSRSTCSRLLALALLLAFARSAAAAPEPAVRDPRRVPDARYVIDGGAVPFWFGSLAVLFAARTFLQPPESPRFFSDSEGGEDFRGDTVPPSVVGVYAAAVGGGLILVPRGARYYHFKGLLETVLTTLAVTEIVKNTVGRHRPHFDVELAIDEDRRSFYSGHSAITAATNVYLGLYLRQHGFAPLRGGRTLPWWELATYGGLAAATVAVPLSRIHDHRHHPSDVLTGGLVGAGAAIGFYAWQQRRFDRDLARYQAGLAEPASARAPPRWLLVPDLEHRGLSLVGWF